MKEYCVDLEIARALKENGFPQRTKHVWIRCSRDNSFECMPSLSACMMPTAWDYEERIASPISDEILKELPKKIPNHQSLCIVKDDQTYWCGYEGKTLKDELASSGKKLSNALAKLWLYLKKEGLLK